MNLELAFEAHLKLRDSMNLLFSIGILIYSIISMDATSLGQVSWTALLGLDLNQDQVVKGRRELRFRVF
jgi:hypothetical protein